MRRNALLAGGFAFAFAFACACASTRSDPAPSATDAGAPRVAAMPTAAPPPPPPAFDAGFFDAGDAEAGACNVRLDMPPLLPAMHVPEGTAITYDSNPPSSGPHYPIWADFQVYTSPVPDGYLVHSEEHGAVLLLYDCPSGCDDVVAELRALRDAVPTDPLCDPTMGERVRVILAPRPDNDAPIAAAAWGNTYKSDCFDGASLAKFIADHYAQGPEDFCSPGQSTF